MATAAEVNQAIDAAAVLGSDHGYAAATWVFDGNTSEATWIQARDDEDFLAAPSPLSGEWADGLTPELLRRELEASAPMADSDFDAICTAYEQAYEEAWWDEVGRAIQAHFS